MMPRMPSKSLSILCAVLYDMLCFASLILAIPNASLALGINCRGSWLAQLRGGPTRINDIIQNGIDPNRAFHSGEHIACVKYIPSPPAYLAGGVCAFLQGTKFGFLGKEVKILSQAIVNHGCNYCGSVPISYIFGGNDPSSGILTINFVGDTNHLCLSGPC